MSDECKPTCECGECRAIRRLIFRLGNECQGESVADVMLAMTTIMAELSVRLGVPKQEFTAQTYEHLCEMIDTFNDMEDNEGDNDNGNRPLH
jgi:hypothetical protein